MANGRTYTGVVGTPQLVPDFDAQVLKANGWIPNASAAGTTAQRPISPKLGYTYFDTTLQTNVIHVGNNTWNHHATGASV